MKKLMATFAVAAMVAAGLPVAGYAASAPIKIMIDGAELKSTAAALLVNGSVIVPSKTIFKSLGATVEWSQVKQQLKATKGSTTIVLTIGSKSAQLNGKVVALNTAPQVIKGTTYIPLKFVAEAFDSTAAWNPKTNSVTINQKQAASVSIVQTAEQTAEQIAKDEDEIKKIIQLRSDYYAKKDAVGLRSTFVKPVESVEFLNKYFETYDDNDYIESFGEIQITGNSAVAIIVLIHEVIEVNNVSGKPYIAAKLKDTMSVQLTKVEGKTWKINSIKMIKGEQIPIDDLVQ
ncbi:copper amine oxidase N-terminal domain-containing protein [Paenibacillus sp. NFR01]|uniref:copper amine oxidase N-terminal domain-containing protein n=1 Tax=Paenibacillus sp. NFR01 TaxID=1566279 RepID=UPI0008C6375E|nr:copper amine oxidase N-terminal domain-containing protein [Paenibacillus sp. NFR01]SET94929.1 Copper amine oxidase N-terminal domain-containing protein [Paenibacillus sp. NFR01]